MKKEAATTPMAPVKDESAAPLFGDWFTGWDWPDMPARWGRIFGNRYPEFMDFARRGETMMRVEQYEEDDHLVVRGELPGVDPDDIEITIEHGRLLIRAEREDKTEERDDKRYRSEFHYGAFERSLMLPPGVTEDDVKATYTDGILDVRLPMGEPEQGARKIPIAHH